MMNCIAVDDEPLALKLLADNISKMPFLKLTALCDDAVSANTALQKNEVDLIFIDIQMPGISGIQFIKSLVKKPMVIIISAYKQYALDGYALDVVDYLVKPVALDRFMKACSKAKELFELKTAKNASNEPPANYTFLNSGFSLIKIVFDEVLYVEGSKDYAKIYFSGNKKPAIVRVTFKYIEQNWPPYFIRTHKSYIINTAHIAAITKNAILIGETELPLGEAYRQTVSKLIRTNK